MSSANNLHSLLSSFGKPLTYFKNKRGPRMEPWGTPARISTQEGHWPNYPLFSVGQKIT